MKIKDVILVAIQFVLLIIYFIIPAGLAKELWVQAISFLITVTGMLLIALSIIQLKSALTPFPTPTKSGTLITTGVYRYIRHPIYTGILFACLGLSIYSFSIPRIIITFMLYLLFQYKSRYEEKLLIIKYEEYQQYITTTGRFLPKLFK